ncbi:MAG: cupin domain-containing protein [Nocardiaceae bacterium]|nr:cupin domain-containing protein [Nocardiaceae bacterium]
MTFESMELPDKPHVTAPDGSDVRILLSLSGGGMAHFELAPSRTSRAVTHRTVEEIWYFTSGAGEMWRSTGELTEVLEVRTGVCLTIPLGTHFQFRSFGPEPLSAVAITMPPWPGEDEAVFVEGPWEPA